MTTSTFTDSLGTFPGRDGLELAYRSTGQGRPLVLLHGFTGTGLQFTQHGLAAALASRGYRVIVPDLRGHGDSSRPHDPAAYPPDILAEDGLALIDYLQLRDYDLGGYSLGGRIVLRMLTRGARPAHAIIGGQGLDALDGVRRSSPRRCPLRCTSRCRATISPRCSARNSKPRSSRSSRRRTVHPAVSREAMARPS
jgi:pimeloyl-ACP methyl ester carboxylesterase